MVRHTPEFLRQRSSNVSLRMAASSTSASAPAASRLSSFANPAEFEAKPTMSEAERAFIIGELKSQRSLTLCDVCYRDIPEIHTDSLPLQLANNRSSCSACMVMDANPEAFTAPFCAFLKENPTIFHSVDYFKTKMTSLGYKELPTREDWAGRIEAGGKYFATRNGSSVIAFAVGKAYNSGNGVAIIAGHIDALTAKVKPVSKKPTTAGYVQLGVAQYAGALNETWWDRDLSIGGRVVVRDESGKTTTKLVKLDWPIARIPTLAPHFGVGMLGQNNKETEAVPIIGLDGPTSGSAESLGPAGSFVSTQPPKLVKLISNELGLKDLSQIVNWELELFDLQPATVGGMDKEFIFAGRIDDKLCSWAAFQGLLASSQNEDEGTIKMVALFDDEEIGSLLRQGAKGNFLPSVIERTVESMCGKEKAFGPGVIGQTYANSFLVSADVTHAVNPNFISRYLADHAPRLNVGICICADSNGHLTTDSVSTAILTRVCELSGCTPQVFQIRNDSRSGGTVGPSISSALGVRAADAGMPQLSMHSIRATCGSLDPGLGVKFFKGFLDKWEQVDAEWQ
ncbi:putative vacuolar aminopeptidase 1 [Rosellinia necatrix]|uniref:Putative vacuolar aminopeptidase 1 n=1 Tax=Rosellinia necatrix TaxID=77044 RepID=A0A1S7ULL7_ROSNE|nr:putative vacuolar aminopeptidase 1 [Rosellinia necatrix]